MVTEITFLNSNPAQRAAFLEEWLPAQLECVLIFILWPLGVCMHMHRIPKFEGLCAGVEQSQKLPWTRRQAGTTGHPLRVGNTRFWRRRCIPFFGWPQLLITVGEGFNRNQIPRANRMKITSITTMIVMTPTRKHCTP